MAQSDWRFSQPDADDKEKALNLYTALAAGKRNDELEEEAERALSQRAADEIADIDEEVELSDGDDLADPAGEVEIVKDEDMPEVELPDDAKDETPNMGVGEHSRMTVRQETGKRADQILHGGNDLYTKTMDLFGVSREGSASALIHAAPFVRQIARFDAAREEKALERLRSGDYKDDEMKEVAAAAGLIDDYELAYRSSLVSHNPNGEMRKLISMAAEDELKRRTGTKQSAGAELERKGQTTWGKIASGTLENSGYVASYIYGSSIAGGLGIGMTAAEGAGVMSKVGVSAVNTMISSAPTSVMGGMERYQRLSKKDYELDAEGQLHVIDNNYSELRSAIQGGVGGFVENTVVEGMTDIAIEVGCLGLAKIPGAQAFIVKPLQRLGNSAVRKMMGNKAGRALIRVGKAYNGISQFTHFNSQPVEMLEEDLQPIFDDVF